MKTCANILALCFLQANILETVTSFSVVKTTVAPSKKASALFSAAPPELSPSRPGPTSENAMFPMNLPMTKIEGGGTLRTWKMPHGVERVQMVFKTDGRPMKARIEMWVGPIRRTHCLDIDMMDGRKTPYRATLKFKKVDSAGPQMLKVSATGPWEFPLWAGVEVPSMELDQQLADATEELIKGDSTVFVQGGAIKSFPIDTHVDSVQLVLSSRRVSQKGSKALIEVLQGPNNKKQEFDLHVAGGSQPYHAVFATPGTGVTLRITSKNVMEYPFEVSVAPYEVGNKPRSPPSYSSGMNKQWWE